MVNERIDPTTLTHEQIHEAIAYHGKKMGSSGYYIADECERYDREPRGIIVFRESATGKLRAYWRKPEPMPNLDEA